MAIYSFGTKSWLKYEITKEYAEAYNRGFKAFTKASENYQRTTPTYHLNRYPLNEVEWEKEGDHYAFNSFATLRGYYCDAISEQDVTEDFLVENPPFVGPLTEHNRFFSKEPTY